ncbi:HupE/UreJ family protein [Pseudoduganella dura]|nr:HupE/UreJ family protein [Pseudoduganella dura]GGX78992.1 membrane protein [Pseudoduganella dura]
MSRVLQLGAALCLALAMAAAWGHPSPHSEILLEGRAGGIGSSGVTSADVRAEITLPLDELALAFGEPLVETPSNHVLIGDERIAAYLAAHIRPVAPDGRAWTVRIVNVRWLLHQRPADVRAIVTLRPPAGAPLDRFTLQVDAIAHHVQSHMTVVALRTDEDAPARIIGTLRFGQRSLAVRGADPRWWIGSLDLFKLGMAHIAEGFDHLLFLLTLLLPAALLVKDGRWQGYGGPRHLAINLLKVVTAFTVGHSLTLLLGAIGAVRVPEQPVEVAIAASILVSAAHAWRPAFPRREAWVAAGFGLVHGLAFGASLRDLDLSGVRLAAGILAFNLGIETMQALIVAVAAPLLVLLARSPSSAHARRVAALCAGAMAVVWVAQRV